MSAKQDLAELLFKIVEVEAGAATIMAAKKAPWSGFEAGAVDVGAALVPFAADLAEKAHAAAKLSSAA